MTDQMFEESLDRYFAIESEELIQTIEQTLVGLLEAKTVERVHTLMRAAHTIKGGAANCGLKTIETIAHHLEDVFQALYPEELVIDDELGALLLEGYEVLYTPISAILSGYECDEEQILTQTADLFARLQAKLGDFFGREAPLPTAEDLGFDIVGLIFGDSVGEDLDKLSQAISGSNITEVHMLLSTQAEFFLELGASYELPGVEEIARATQRALELHPEQVMKIAAASWANFQTAREQILAGDRATGGEVSTALAFWTQADIDLTAYNDLEPTFAVASTPVAAVENIAESVAPSDADDFVELFDFGADLPAAAATDLLGLLDLEPESRAANETADLLGLFDLEPESRAASETADLLGLLETESPAANEPEDLLSLLDVELEAESTLTDRPGAPVAEPEVSGLWMAEEEAPTDDYAIEQLDISSAVVIEPELSNPIAATSGDREDQSLELLELLDVASLEPSDSSAESQIAAGEEPAEQIADLLDLLDDAGLDSVTGELIESAGVPEAAEIIERITALAPEPFGIAVPEGIAPDSPTNPAGMITLATGSALQQVEGNGEDDALTPIDRILLSISTFIPEVQPPAEPPAPVTNNNGPVIRVALDRLDRLGNAIGELMIDENQQNTRAERIHSLNQAAVEELARANYQLSRIRDWSDRNLLNTDRPRFQRVNTDAPGFDALEMDVYSDLHILIQQLNDHLEELGGRLEQLENSTQKLRVRQDKRRQIFTSAQDELLQARMEPISTVFDRFPRLVQQMTIKHKKPAELVLIGTGVLVDKAVADKLYDPLLHLIRNSYDHGLEGADLRAQRGKPATGRITVAAYHHGNRTTIEVKDDGGGLNFERIRQKGVERQLLSPAQAQTASEDQLAELLFHPGFSTADQISELSGRGIGLDVVRTQIEAFGGLIAVRSSAGQGTTFSLQIPLSFTTARLLICEAKGRTYALLSDALNQAIIPQPDRLQSIDNGSRTLYRQQVGTTEQLIAVRGLAEIMDYNCPLATVETPNGQTSEQMSLLLVSTPDQKFCLAVDKILGEQELAITSIDNSLPLPSYIQGYSTLSDGSLVLAVDPVELVTANHRPAGAFSRRGATPVPEQPLAVLPMAEEVVEAELLTHHAAANQAISILVVDDSLVQRQSLQRTLAGAGYRVLQAANGQEALAQLNQHPEVRAVVCDIEMPYMNGFEFLSYCRQDARLAEIPTVMLTTRSGAKHRQLALALGAKAYTTKPHADRELLSVVEKLLNPDLAMV